MFEEMLEVLGRGFTLHEEPARGALTEAARQAGVTKGTMWARWHPERVDRAKKADQARRWREELRRPEWEEYCAAYRARWPGAPIGFGRWLAEKHYQAWSVDRAAVLSRRNERTCQAALKVFDLARADRHK